MIKHFILQRRMPEARIFDYDNNVFIGYRLADISDSPSAFPFGEFILTPNQMGYKDMKECYTQLKKRWKPYGLMGKEVDHDHQQAEEVKALLILADYRAKHGASYEYITGKLQKFYGFSQADAENKVNEYISGDQHV